MFYYFRNLRICDFGVRGDIMDNVKKTVFSALFAALICVATMLLKIPIPAFGYIHPGDGLVLLAGIFL